MLEAEMIVMNSNAKKEGANEKNEENPIRPGDCQDTHQHDIKKNIQLSFLTWFLHQLEFLW